MRKRRELKRNVLINIVLSHLGSHVTPRFVTWRDTVTCHNVNIVGRVCGHLRFQGSYKDSGDSETGTGSGYWEYPWHQQSTTRYIRFCYVFNLIVLYLKYQSTYILGALGNSQLCKGCMNENLTLKFIDSFVIPKIIQHYLLFQILFIHIMLFQQSLNFIAPRYLTAIIRCNVNVKFRCLNNDAITGYLVR